MSLKFKHVPLTFLNDSHQIEKHIRNTIILSYFFQRNEEEYELDELIEGTQYGYNASALKSGANKFLRISDITDGTVNWSTVPFCDCSDEETYLLKKNDLLIARTGGTTGKSFLIENPPSKAVYAGYLIRIRANQSNLPAFLNLFLNSYAYWSQIISLNKGDFRPSVNATKLKKLIVPKCSKQEQKDAIRISHRENVKGYGELTKLIEKTISAHRASKKVLEEIQTQKQLLTQLQQAILQEAVEGKLTAEWRKRQKELEPASQLLVRIKAEKARLVKEKKIKAEKPLASIQAEDVPFELPEGWVWCRLGEISRIGTGATPLTTNKSYYDNGNIPWITSSATGNLFVNEADNFITSRAIYETNCKINSIGTLIIAMYGQGKTRGQITELNIEAATNQACATINPYLNKVENNRFIKLYFQNIYLEIRKIAQGGAQPNLNMSKIKNTILPLPPLQEQEEIVQKVEALMQQCKALEAEIAHSEQQAQQLMQSVLKEAFEGKKAVVVKNEEQLV